MSTSKPPSSRPVRHRQPSRLSFLLSLPFSLVFPALITCSYVLYSAYHSTSTDPAPRMPPKPPLNPRNFPRPPLLEKTARHLQIKWDGVTIADTKDAYWVLETTHPPTYYLPPTSLSPTLKITKLPNTSYCEWKGRATYWELTHPNDPSKKVGSRVWSYEAPTSGFTSIKDYLSFYAGPWDCYVDDELVEPQPGDFYGGWVTSEIVGQVKGGPGTWGW